MHIELSPRIEALLHAQVAAGHFTSIEEAVTAAVLGMPLSDDKLGDLAWAKPLIDEADVAIAENRTSSDPETYADLERRFGKI